jgi:DNA repair exonuclease SbcCD ATPase subunit
MVKKTITIEAKADKAIEEIEQLKKEIKELNKEVTSSNKKTEEGLKSVEDASKTTAKSLKGIGTAIKAIGIGLLLEAFNFFKQTIGENQKALDLFNTVFETMSLAFNDFINFTTNNFGKVTGFFKAIFDDPKQSLIDFANAFKKNIQERFESYLDTLGFLASAVKKVFSGDFAGALEDVKSAGKESLDVITGVNNSFDKGVDAVKKVTKATTDYVKETVNAASANVELNKQAEVARVLQQGLVETFDRQAEKLRQVRDEERNTIADRIKANNELNTVLDEQEDAMLEQVQTQIAAAQAAYDKNKNQENYIALLEATQEKEAVLAQIEGFRSEQKSNDLALERERIELEQTAIDGATERANKEAMFLAEQIEGEYLRLQAIQDVADREREIEEQRLLDKRNLYKEGTQAFADANQELENYKKDADLSDIEREKKIKELKKKLTTQAIGDLISIVGANSKFGKGLAVVQAIRDTYAGANKALSAAPPPFNFISAAAVIAGGIANVKKITSTKEPAKPTGIPTRGGGGSSSISVPSSTPPTFTTVGTSGINQLAETIQGQAQKPIKAFVVSSEVTTAQSLDRNIVREAGI